MRLSIKILTLLALLMILVLFLFTSTAIYYFYRDKTADSLNSKQLFYELFLPTLGKDLWEFDTLALSENIKHIILNEYADSIEIFETDGKFIAGYALNIKNGTIQPFQYDESYTPVSVNYIKNYLKPKKSEKNSDDFILISDPNVESRKIGIVYKKKESSQLFYPYGYIVFNYKMETFGHVLSYYYSKVIYYFLAVTIVLIIVIGVFLRRFLINPILKLSQASIDISSGNFTRLYEEKGKDEMKELIRNFNNMGLQISENQERLKLLALEGVSISSSVTFTNLAVKVVSAIKNIAGKDLNALFYLSSRVISLEQKIGFVLIDPMNFEFDRKSGGIVNFKEENIIKYGHEYSIPENKKRLFVLDNMTAEVICICQYDTLSTNKIVSYQDGNIYAAIETLYMSIGHAILNINFIDEQKEQQKLVAEQETARLVQSNLLPSSELRTIGRFELTSFFQPAGQCAGDWWSYYHLNDGRLLLLLGDVTGHGTASALVAGVVKGYCDSIEDCKNHILVEDILTRLDRVISNSAKQDRVMTMFAAIIDPNTGEVQFSNASHNFPFMISSHEGENKITLSRLIAKGKPLGFKSSEIKNSFYKSTSLKMNVGDSLFIFSDGLVEAENHNEEMYGDRLKEVLKLAPKKTTEGLKTALIQNFSEFVGTETIRDDISFVICKLTKNPNP